MRGFSLVELSIVLVILGLLVGGVLAAQSLLHAAKLRGMSTEVTNHITAIHSFRIRYHAIPGDMVNAVRFWGAQAGGTADGVDADCQLLDATTPATDKRTCNGNGNGLISVNTPKETYRAWQHLANAGLIEGQFSGVSYSSSNLNYSRAGVNTPVSRMQGGYTLNHQNNVAIHYPGRTQFMIHGNATEGDDPPHLLARDLWNIDSKMDDGKPGIGRVRAPVPAHRPLCATDSDPALAEYQLTTTTPGCTSYFLF